MRLAKKHVPEETPAYEPAASHVSPFLNTLQAAEYLLISPKKLEKMRWVGNGPRYRKHFAIVVYHIEDLKTWSADNMRNSTSE